MRAVSRPAALLLLIAPAPLWAHDLVAGGSGAPGWTLDAWIVAPLLIAAVLFTIGWMRLAGRSMRGRPELRRRGAVYAAGLLVLATALVSPLHQMGERSFAAHMIEHELIMLLAAPLLVLAGPLAIMLWAFPPPARVQLGAIALSAPVAAAWRTIAAPLPATLIQATALWLWHAPALFDRALASEGWHAAQHLSFLVSALLFWTAMLARRTPRALAALCLVATSIVSGALGALMAVATSPWYIGYARLGMAPLGLTPAEDQQVAGLVMWVPGGLVHAGAALLIVRAMLARMEPRHAV